MLDLVAVLWDIDDVLVDTKQFQRKTQRAAYDCLGLDTLDYNKFEECWDHLLWYFDQEDYLGILRAIANELDLDLSQDVMVFASKKADQVWDHTLPKLQGVDECLQYLIDCDIKLGIVSNGNLEEQHSKLVNSGLLRYFNQETIIISPSKSVDAKPNPNSILKCCAAMKILPGRNVIYVGDRRTDIIAANLAKLSSVLLLRDAPENKEPHISLLKMERPNLTVNSINEFYRWIKERNHV